MFQNNDGTSLHAIHVTCKPFRQGQLQLYLFLLTFRLKYLIKRHIGTVYHSKRPL